MQTPANAEPSRDRWGRLQYHPDLHAKHGKAWTTTEQRYLIERYEKDGPEQVSMALERTMHTVMQYAYRLRKKGIMAAPKGKRSYIKRIGSPKPSSADSIQR